MTHTMRLAPEPFAKLKSGSKKVEARLNDEKRRGVRVCDWIRFVSMEDSERTLLAIVTGILRFGSFEELYAAVPLRDLGYGPDEVDAASPDDMLAYYTREEQERHGVVGFVLQLVSEEESLMDTCGG